MRQINFGNKEEFIKKYNELKSSRKMAEYYNCSKGAILNYAKRIGYDNSQNQITKIVNIPIEQVIKDYEELKNIDKVGQKYNCSGTAVLNYLNKHNYQCKNHNNKSQYFNKEQFIQDYNNLKSAEKMSQLYNCSNTTILNYAQKIGYDVNSNKEYKLSQDDKKYIIEHYNDISSTELAKQFNVSRGMITKLWFDAGLSGKEIQDSNTTEIDITGKDFGYWHVMYKTNKCNASGVIYWHCKCKCGVEKDILSTSLRQRLSLSCGNHKNISKGNYEISQLLLDADIPFETEKTFSTCKDKKELPFDFYVNNEYLIEYDGIQHFQETIFDYEYIHNHDLIKSKWCKENNIPLIRIPYTHFDELCLIDLLPELSSFLEK